MYDITLYVIMSVVDHVAERAAYKYGPSWSMLPSWVYRSLKHADTRTFYHYGPPGPPQHSLPHTRPGHTIRYQMSTSGAAVRHL